MDRLENRSKIISSLPTGLQFSENDDFDDFLPVINLQKAVYENYIDDLQRRIKRIQIKNEQMEILCENMIEDYKYRNTKAENKFVAINMDITSAIKKLDEDKKNFTELENLRIKRKFDHHEKVKYLARNFENKRIELYLKIKELNTKINMLEDYKLADESLRKKYNKQNQSLYNKEKHMQEILNDMEYTSKLHKENLKKEAYKKILNVSDTFQNELKTTVPLTIKKLMRENIVLQNELFRLRTDCTNMSEKIFIHNNHMQECKKKIKNVKLNIRYQIFASKIQNLLLKKFESASFTLMDVLSTSSEKPEDYGNNLKFIENIRNHYYNCDFDKRKLEVIFHQEIIKLEFAKILKSKTSFNLKNLSNTLHILKSYINSNHLSASTNVEDFRKMDLESCRLHLLNIIESYDLKKWVLDSGSIKTITDARKVYVIGDLGFEPILIEANRINEEIEKAYSVLSYNPSLLMNEFDKLSNKFIQHEENSVLSTQKTSHDSISVVTSLSSKTSSSQSSISRKESITDKTQNKIEVIVDALSENEVEESEFDLEDIYEDYLDYRQD